MAHGCQKKKKITNPDLKEFEVLTERGKYYHDDFYNEAKKLISKH